MQNIAMSRTFFSLLIFGIVLRIAEGLLVVGLVLGVDVITGTQISDK